MPSARSDRVGAVEAPDGGAHRFTLLGARCSSGRGRPGRRWSATSRHPAGSTPATPSRSGTDAPCTSACSTHEQPAGPQQPGRRRCDDPHRRRGRPARRTAPAPGRARRPRGRGSWRRRDVRRVATRPRRRCRRARGRRRRRRRAPARRRTGGAGCGWRRRGASDRQLDGVHLGAGHLVGDSGRRSRPSRCRGRRRRRATQLGGDAAGLVDRHAGDQLGLRPRARRRPGRRRARRAGSRPAR